MSIKEVKNEVQAYPWYEENAVRLHKLRQAIQVHPGWTKEEHYWDDGAEKHLPVTNPDVPEDEICVTLRSQDYVVGLRLIDDSEEYYRQLWLFRTDKKTPTYEEAFDVCRPLLPEWVEISKGALDNKDFYGEIETDPQMFNGFKFKPGVDPEDDPTAHYAIVLHMNLNDRLVAVTN